MIEKTCECDRVFIGTQVTGALGRTQALRNDTWSTLGYEGVIVVGSTPASRSRAPSHTRPCSSQRSQSSSKRFSKSRAEAADSSPAGKLWTTLLSTRMVDASTGSLEAAKRMSRIANRKIWKSTRFALSATGSSFHCSPLSIDRGHLKPHPGARPDGEGHDASVYVARDEMIDDSMMPTRSYRDPIVNAARANGLPVDYVDELARKAVMES